MTEAQGDLLRIAVESERMQIGQSIESNLKNLETSAVTPKEPAHPQGSRVGNRPHDKQTQKPSAVPPLYYLNSTNSQNKYIKLG